MKKVLFVFNHPAPYKVRLLNTMAEYLDLDVIFERHNAKDRNQKFYFEQQFKFKLLPIRGKAVGKENFISKGIVEQLKRKKYDLIIMNGYSHQAERKAIKFIKRKKLPYCLYINGGIIAKKESKLKKRYKTKFIRGASLYMSPDEISDKYLVYYGALKNRIKRYTYSTIYESEILKKPLSKDEVSSLKKELGISAEKVYISCGQLIPRKNYLELIKAWPTDKDKMLIIAGDGEQKKLIEDYIRTNYIQNVKLIGYLERNEVFKYYHISEAFLFPSLKDIYGHVINEALSQGLPIISFPNVNSAQKLIKNGENGYIVNTVDEMISALDKIDSCKRENCIKTAKENTIEIMAEEHKKILA